MKREQTDPVNINIFDVVNFLIPVWTKSVRQEIIVNYFRHLKICSGDVISGNMNEPTCKNFTYELEVID